MIANKIIRNIFFFFNNKFFPVLSDPGVLFYTGRSVLFDKEKEIKIDAKYVQEKLDDIVEDEDLSRYIL